MFFKRLALSDRGLFNNFSYFKRWWIASKFSRRRTLIAWDCPLPLLSRLPLIVYTTCYLWLFIDMLPLIVYTLQLFTVKHPFYLYIVNANAIQLFTLKLLVYCKRQCHLITYDFIWLIGQFNFNSQLFNSIVTVQHYRFSSYWRICVIGKHDHWLTDCRLSKLTLTNLLWTRTRFGVI